MTDPRERADSQRGDSSGKGSRTGFGAPSGRRSGAGPATGPATGSATGPAQPAATGHLDYLLTAYLFDSISPAGRRKVEDHLASCEECRRELEAVRGTLEVLGATVASAEADPTEYRFEERRLERVLEAHEERGPIAFLARWRTLGRWRWPVGVAAAALLLGVFLRWASVLSPPSEEGVKIAGVSRSAPGEQPAGANGAVDAIVLSFTDTKRLPEAKTPISAAEPADPAAWPKTEGALVPDLSDVTKYAALPETRRTVAARPARPSKPGATIENLTNLDLSKAVHDAIGVGGGSGEGGFSGLDAEVHTVRLFNAPEADRATRKLYEESFGITGMDAAKFRQNVSATLPAPTTRAPAIRTADLDADGAVDLTASANEQVQGLVAGFEWDAADPSAAKAPGGDALASTPAGQPGSGPVAASSMTLGTVAGQPAGGVGGGGKPGGRPARREPQAPLTGARASKLSREVAEGDEPALRDFERVRKFEGPELLLRPQGSPAAAGSGAPAGAPADALARADSGRALDRKAANKGIDKAQSLDRQVALGDAGLPGASAPATVSGATVSGATVSGATVSEATVSEATVSEATAAPATEDAAPAPEVAQLYGDAFGRAPRSGGRAGGGAGGDAGEGAARRSAEPSFQSGIAATRDQAPRPQLEELKKRESSEAAGAGTLGALGDLAAVDTSGRAVEGQDRWAGRVQHMVEEGFATPRTLAVGDAEKYLKRKAPSGEAPAGEAGGDGLVTVESRFLDIQDDFLDQIGIAFDAAAPTADRLDAAGGAEPGGLASAGSVDDKRATVRGLGGRYGNAVTNGAVTPSPEPAAGQGWSYGVAYDGDLKELAVDRILFDRPDLPIEGQVVAQAGAQTYALGFQRYDFWGAPSAGKPARGGRIDLGKLALLERRYRALAHYQATDPGVTLETLVRRELPVPPPEVGDEGLGAEEFLRKHGVNPFVDTRRDHLSTFAMDVDTASWTLARAALRSGKLPDPKTVRTEECVNAFRDAVAGDLATDPDSAFSFFGEGGPSPYGDGLELVKLTVKARDLRENERKDAVLTIVVDTSGSMAAAVPPTASGGSATGDSGTAAIPAGGDASRLDLVKGSLRTLLDALGPDDRIGIVAYGTHPCLVLPHSPARERSRILGAIESLSPSGATNVEAGLDMAYRVADEVFEPKALNRIVLCSDGVANLGARGPEEILRKIDVFAKRGVYLSAVGFGMGKYDDRMLETLANRGNGNYAYVDALPEAARIFRENLPATLQVLAQDAKIQVDFNPEAVSHYRLLGYENRDVRDQDFRNDKVDAGEVGPGTTVTVLYEIRRHANPRGDLGRIYLRYRDVGTGRVEESSYPLSPGLLATRIEDTTDRFRFAASVAELAELLRKSYWSRDGSCGKVLAVLGTLSPAFLARPEVSEAVEMVLRAQALTIQELARR